MVNQRFRFGTHYLLSPNKRCHALGGAAVATVYKSISLLTETPKNIVVPHMLAPFSRIQKSARLVHLFTLLEPFMSIYVKWPPVLLPHLEFLASAHEDVLDVLRNADHVQHRILELSGTKGDEIINAHANLSLQQEMIKNEELQAMMITTNNDNNEHREDDPSSLKKRRRAIEACVVSLREMLVMVNTLLEQAIKSRVQVRALMTDFKFVLRSFNRYWSQCGTILMSDPSVFLSQFVALKNASAGTSSSSSSNNILKAMSANERDKYFRAVTTGVTMACQEIERKRALVDTIINDGVLPGDVGEEFDPNDARAVIRTAHQEYYQWWFKKHCRILPTMQIIALENEWISPKKYSSNNTPNVDKNAQQADTFKALLTILQDVNDDNDDNEEHDKTRARHTSAELAKFIHTEGQMITSSNNNLTEWLAMVDSYKTGKPSAKAMAKYTSMTIRPVRNGSLKETIAFWYSRTNNEGWKSVINKPYAGFKLGIGDMSYLPTTPLAEDEINRLFRELDSIINTIVSHSLFVAQLQLVRIESSEQSNLWWCFS